MHKKSFFFTVVIVQVLLLKIKLSFGLKDVVVGVCDEEFTPSIDGGSWGWCTRSRASSPPPLSWCQTKGIAVSTCT